jgi:putative oxidoreductase
MKKILFNVVSCLFALLLLNGGLNKFFNYMPVPDDLPAPLLKDTEAILEIEWLMPLIGSAEVIGALLLLFPRTRALGLLVVFPVMVGVLLTHMIVDPSGIPMVIIIWSIMGWIVYENREKYLGLLK